MEWGGNNGGNDIWEFIGGGDGMVEENGGSDRNLADKKAGSKNYSQCGLGQHYIICVP